MEKEETGNLVVTRMPKPTMQRPRQEKLPRTWLWLAIILIIGLLLFIVISMNASTLLGHISLANSSAPQQPAIKTLIVHRTAPYAGLAITVVKAQDATYFQDDEIRSSPAVVRLILHVSNPTTNQIGLVYYDITRLLLSRQTPIAPTLVQLSSSLASGKNATGWIDFPVPRRIALDTMSVQFGSTALSESLVTIPFSGLFDASAYANRHMPLSLTITYDYYGHILYYHLHSIDVLYAYQGQQCQAGRRFYQLNFIVTNPASVDVSTGFGFDYVRLVINGNNLPPIDNSLPYTFKASAQSVGGRVVFAAPAGMKTIIIGLLSQNGTGQQNTDVSL